MQCGSSIYFSLFKMKIDYFRFLKNVSATSVLSPFLVEALASSVGTGASFDPIEILEKKNLAFDNGEDPSTAFIVKIIKWTSPTI